MSVLRCLGKLAFPAIIALFLLIGHANGQVALAPALHPQFVDSSGNLLAGGFVYTYAAGTTTLQATFADSLGTIQNANPIPLDATGSPSNSSGAQVQIWLSNLSYKICAYNSALVQQWCWDNVSSYQILSGSLAFTGTLTATQFIGPATSWASPITISTATNKPTVTTTNPAASGQNYQIPDPATPTAHFVMDQGATNGLNCTDGVITCQRTASFYFGGGSCSGSTATLGWDTFLTNNPLAFCLTGANTQKAVMGLPSAYAHVQQNSGTSAAAGTITTTYPNATLGGNGDMLVLSVAFNATTTITGCTDGTNAYSQAKHIANGALSLDIWVFHNATAKAAGTTVTCTFSANASGALKWHEYLAPNATSTDVSASNSGSSTSATTGTTASTAQATELVFAAAGDLAAPSLVPAGAGYVDHVVVNNSTTVQVDDAGIIQQAIAAQSTTFTLGTSQAWAAAIVTFKATNGGNSQAQKTIVLPAFFNASQAVNSVIEWSNPLIAIGTSNVSFSAAISCTAQGTTDDPVFNTASTASSAASQSAANTTAQVSLAGLTSTGCAAGNVLHYQVSRQRYNAADIYEGFANVYGSALAIGITQ